MLETQSNIVMLALIGGLHSPTAATANAFGGVAFFVGSYLYSVGYASNMKNGEGRVSSGGGGSAVAPDDPHPPTHSTRKAVR